MLPVGCFEISCQVQNINLLNTSILAYSFNLMWHILGGFSSNRVFVLIGFGLILLALSGFVFFGVFALIWFFFSCFTQI